MRFTETHEWIHDQNGVGTVGISSHAQSELGEIVHVELPKVGMKVEAGEEICVLESTKAAADLYAPVSGTITEVNQRLKESVESINLFPESDGWIFRIALLDPSACEKLLPKKEYDALISGSKT